MAGHFEERIADQGIREKIRANDHATLVEANYAQVPAHVASLSELLGCQPLPVPTFDSLIPYEVSDERGAALPLEQVIPTASSPTSWQGSAGHFKTGSASSHQIRPRETEPAGIGPSDGLGMPSRGGGRAPATWALLGPPRRAERVLPLRWPNLRPSGLRPSKVRQRRCSNGGDEDRGRASERGGPGELADRAKDRPDQGHIPGPSKPDRDARQVRLVGPAGAEAKLGNLAQHYEEVATPETLRQMVDSLIDRGATLAELVMTVRGLKRGSLITPTGSKRSSRRRQLRSRRSATCSMGTSGN